jgi:DNA topoisomerase-1
VGGNVEISDEFHADPPVGNKYKFIADTGICQVYFMKILSKKNCAAVLDILRAAYPEAGCALDHGNNFELLVKVVLSAQTTDKSVNAVSPELFGRYEDADSREARLPHLTVGQAVVVDGLEPQGHETTPPPRYTEASLVAALEKRGIGRPSTYASIMENISSRGYISENKKRQLEATALGERLISRLVGNFAFADYEFTKNMEEQLDEIAAGKNEYLSVVRAANTILEKELGAYLKASGIACPDCGSLVEHWEGVSKKTGRPYNFWTCSNKECRAAFNDDNGQLGPKREKQEPAPLSEHKCPDCGRPLRHLVKKDQGDQKGWNFWACSGFRDEKNPCRGSYADAGGRPGQKKALKSPPSDFKCPKCKKPLYRRQGLSRKTGREYDFYVCSDRTCKLICKVKADGRPDFTSQKTGQ